MAMSVSGGAVNRQVATDSRPAGSRTSPLKIRMGQQLLEMSSPFRSRLVDGDTTVSVAHDTPVDRSGYPISTVLLPRYTSEIS